MEQPAIGTLAPLAASLGCIAPMSLFVAASAWALLGWLRALFERVLIFGLALAGLGATLAAPFRFCAITERSLERWPRDWSFG